MTNIVFENEHLLPGQLGHFFIVLTFITSLLSFLAYTFHQYAKDEKLARTYFLIGRGAFVVMGLSVVGIVSALFYVIYNHLFEYYYAWHHSSIALPAHYMLSCFWEGQEGSFLLWMFWQAFLGSILLFTAKKWEAPVVAVIAFSQLFLSSMLLGVFIKLPNLNFMSPDFLHLFSYKVGSNPFQLLRIELSNAPIFSQPDYLKNVLDGNGLNPLLQNYWMVIHPPVLFLGFSSTIVPCAYAIAGWWRKDYTGWTKPVWGWSLFSGAVLSLGIMMGAAWAYEALTFGGYWAWDPVENASIMPWITLIAGIHTLLAYRHSGHALFSTFLFFVSTFLLVMYASFLTRSGILGETSVHAFTDLGLGGQLVFYILAFLIPITALAILRYKQVPTPAKEETFSSREFWLFIGSLVLLISIIQITFTTSIPVYNKLLGLKLAPPPNAIQHYNSTQIWVAILLAFLSASVQYFRYKQTDWMYFVKRIGFAAIGALAITVPLIFYFQFNKPGYWLLLFASLFSVIANIQYLITQLKTKVSSWGGSIAHVGFALMMIGILISSFKQQVISINHSGVDLGEGFDHKGKMENILLYKNVPVTMNGYEVTYLGDSTVEPNIYYKVNYVKRNKDGSISEQFQLHPNAQINPKMGLISSPDTRHYLTHDIYTHVTSVPDKRKDDKEINASDYTMHKIHLGDTIVNMNSYAILEKVSGEVERKDVHLLPGDIAVSAHFKVIGNNNVPFNTEAVYLIHNRMTVPVEANVKDLGVKIFINQVLPSEQSFEIAIAEKTPAPDYIILKALDFPYINILWIGVLVLVAGFCISIVKRSRKSKN